jgi:N-ethylmaleimide reductase
MSTPNALFSPLVIGPTRLKHRVVMAPLTRSRSLQPDSIPSELMREYYGQRASDGGLLITEATNISLTSRGWLGAPGLYSPAQVAGWRRITEEVHGNGAAMFAQLWHTGRSSHVSMTGGATPVSASVTPAYWTDAHRRVSTPVGWVQPSPHRSLTAEEIAAVVVDYRRAAERAMDAGFDGVELHAANGYLIDQFLQDGSNRRTDRYGGSIENRTRLLVDVVTALVAVWGPGRVGVRIAPDGTWNGMSDSDPHRLFTHIATRMNLFELAYLHLIEPRIGGSELIRPDQGAEASKLMRGLYQGRLIAAGGFEPDTAELLVREGTVDAVAFGRHFIANPDLPRRIRGSYPLSAYDRSTFYTFDARGYTDYPRFEPTHDTAAA